MGTYSQLLYHIVFSTKHKESTLSSREDRNKLYRYIWGVIKNKKSVLYQINGIEDHVHILTHIHPSISVSDFVKAIKVSSSIWIKEENVFPGFKSWQEGYACFTYSLKEKGVVCRYIKNQEKHHENVNYKSELISLLKDHNVKFNPQYLL